MFGIYEIKEQRIKVDKAEIELEERRGYYIYRRKLNEEIKEKIISSESGKIVINPVEPVNLPRNITNFLQIKFKNPAVIEPESSATFFTTFPIEIGVFVTGKGSLELIDVFSFVSQKYSLYGSPIRGLICRYWESELRRDIKKESFREGAMQINIKNSDKDWVEVSNAVFNVQLMKIYYSDDFASSMAEMEVLSSKVAETRFIASPINAGMKKAIEIFSPRKVVAKKFFMEWGV